MRINSQRPSFCTLAGGPARPGGVFFLAKPFNVGGTAALNQVEAGVRGGRDFKRLGIGVGLKMVNLGAYAALPVGD